jgi:hypothetical protein
MFLFINQEKTTESNPFKLCSLLFNVTKKKYLCKKNRENGYNF